MIAADVTDGAGRQEIAMSSEFRSIDPASLNDHDLLIRHDQMLVFILSTLDRIQESRAWPWRTAGTAAIGAIVGTLVTIVMTRIGL